MDNLYTFDLRTEMNNLYQQIEDSLEEYIDLLVEAGLLEEEDEVDVSDGEWVAEVVNYVYEQTHDEELKNWNDEIGDYKDLRETIGEEPWDNNIELIHEDNAEDLGEEFVINFVVGDRDALDRIREHIDFKAIGEEVLTDYTSVEFRGETYYYQE